MNDQIDLPRTFRTTVPRKALVVIHSGQFLRIIAEDIQVPAGSFWSLLPDQFKVMKDGKVQKPSPGKAFMVSASANEKCFYISEAEMRV